MTNEVTVQDAPVVPMLSEEAQVLSIIERASQNPEVNVEKMAALFELHEKVLKRKAETVFVENLADLASVLPRVKRNGTIDLGVGKDGKPRAPLSFAKWEDMDSVIRPLLTDRGFFLSFSSEPRSGEGGGLIVTGTLSHRAGHSMSASVTLPLDTGPGRNNLQAMGSSISYGKRYVAEMLLNIVREGSDNDGNSLPLTPESVKSIEALLAETKADLAGFLKFMGVSDVKDIQQKDYAKAMNALMLKKRNAA